MKKCYYCDEEFLSQEDLEQHLVANHADQFQMGAAQLGEIAGRQIFAGKIQTAVSVAAQLTAIYFNNGHSDEVTVEEIAGIHGNFCDAVMKQMNVDELAADLQHFLDEADADAKKEPSEG